MCFFALCVKFAKQKDLQWAWRITKSADIFFAILKLIFHDRNGESWTEVRSTGINFDQIKFTEEKSQFPLLLIDSPNFLNFVGNFKWKVKEKSEKQHKLFN